MLSKQDRAEVMKLLADVKKELRKEIWDASNRNHEDKIQMKSNTESAQSTIDYNLMMGNLEDPEMEVNTDD